MARFSNSHNQKNDPSAQPPNPAQRVEGVASHARGSLWIKSLGFDVKKLPLPFLRKRKTPEASGSLESLGFDDLLFGSPAVSANTKARHVEPGVLRGELADAMIRIEDKFHGGVYDAAAMPLVEAYLEELRKLAAIQVKRGEIVGQRVADIKEANAQAYIAVSKQREARAAEICEEYEAAQLPGVIRREERNLRRAIKKERRISLEQERDERRQAAAANKAVEEAYKIARKKRKEAQAEAEAERKAAVRAVRDANRQACESLKTKGREDEAASARAAAEAYVEQERLKLANARAAINAEAAREAERLAEAKAAIAAAEAEAAEQVKKRAAAEAEAREQARIAEEERKAREEALAAERKALADAEAARREAREERERAAKAEAECELRVDDAAEAENADEEDIVIMAGAIDDEGDSGDDCDYGDDAEAGAGYGEDAGEADGEDEEEEETGGAEQVPAVPRSTSNSTSERVSGFVAGMGQSIRNLFSDKDD